MKIAIASLGDPRSVSTWSGIPSNIVSALERRGHDMSGITLKLPPEPWYFNWLRRFHHHINRKWFLGSVEAQWLKAISQQLDGQVNHIKPDVVLVVHGDWLAYATFDCPACIIHDTTFASIVDYYPTFTNLTARSLRMGDTMYQRALDKSVAAVFSAQWASHSAICQYGAPESKVFTIPFGANLVSAPTSEEVAMWTDCRAKSDCCNLVFIGTQWDRKGGPDALSVVAALNRWGIKSTLTVIGCAPEIPREMKQYVRVVGYLDKSKPDDHSCFNALMQEAHALIVLSHAECYGCVYCEANAYGLPALARDTGGVSEIIRDGVNGLLLHAGESTESLAERWINIWKNRDAYKRLAISSYREFAERLNYDVFVSKLEEVLLFSIQNNH